MSTTVPGVERASTPIAARACETRKPRLGPAHWAGKPTVRNAQRPGGHRMTNKPMPAAERQRKTTRSRTSPSSWSSWITGRIPGPLPGLETALTWSGDPTDRRQRQDPTNGQTLMDGRLSSRQHRPGPSRRPVGACCVPGRPGSSDASAQPDTPRPGLPRLRPRVPPGGRARPSGGRSADRHRCGRTPR